MRLFRKRPSTEHLKTDILNLETTTRCNANCVYCGRPKENNDMDLDLLKAIVDVAPFIEEVFLQSRGEPLLYPHLIEAIEYCKSKDKKVSFYTNGSLLDLKYANQLLDAGVDRIRFSIDDCDPIRFAEKRKGLNLKTIERSLRTLITLRNERNAPLFIDVRATVTDTNKPYLKDIERHFSFADGVAFVHEFGVNRDLPLYSWSKARALVCPDAFRTITVRWNGQAVLCCNDWEDNFPIGKPLGLGVTESDLLNIAEDVRFIGRRMARGELPTICVSCRNRQRG